MAEGYPDFEDKDRKSYLSPFLRMTEWQMAAAILWTYFGPGYSMSRSLGKEIATQLGFDIKRVPGSYRDEVYIVTSEWTAEGAEYHAIDGVFFEQRLALKKVEEVRAKLYWARDVRVGYDKFRVEA